MKDQETPQAWIRHSAVSCDGRRFNQVATALKSECRLLRDIKI